MSSCPSFARRRPVFALAVLCLLAFTAGCGSNSSPTAPQKQNPTISLSIDTTSASVEQGSSTDVHATVTDGGGFSGSVSLTVKGAPSGVTGKVGDVKSSGGTTTATVTISVGATVAPGSYDLTVRATGSGVAASEAAFSLTVTEASGFELSATTQQLVIEQGSQSTTEIDIARTNFSGDVNLAVEGAPGGLTASFDTNPVSGNSATLTIAVDDTVTPDTYTLTIRGTATGLPDRTVDIDVMVTAPGASDYMLGVAPSPLTVDQGGSGDATVTVTRSNFADPVALSAEGVPTGVGVTFADNPVSGNTTTMTVTVDGTVATGDYTFTLRGKATGLADKTLTVDLTVESAPAYTMALSPTTITIDQSASGTVEVTLSRTNFTGAVDLSVENLPTGVTGSFDNDPLSGNAAVLTLDVGGSVTPGDYTLTVRGTAAGLADRTATLTLAVAEAPGFSLDAVAALSVQQGSSGARTVTITRTGGFTGDVTVTVTGMPSGVTASVDPTTTSGTSVDVTIDVGSGVGVGDYTLTLHGNATGQPESTQDLALSVTPAPSGEAVSLDFSTCAAIDRPDWFAYQDGTGPWTQVTGVGDVYSFDIASAKAGVAIKTTSSTGGTSVVAFYATQSEFVSLNAEELCDTLQPTGKTVTGSVSGLGTGEQAMLSLGDATTQAPADGSVTFDAVPSGNLDLVGFKSSVGDATDRMIFMRDLDPSAGADIGTIDFAANGFDPASGTITVQGGSLGAGQWEVDYATSPITGVCYVAPLQSGSYSGTQFTARGAPSGEQQSGDFHVFKAREGINSVSESFADMMAHTISFGQALPTPTITDISGTGAYRRVRVELTLPSDYNSIAQIAVTDNAADRGIAALATPGWLGGLSVSIEIPDLTGATGWNDSWAPTSASTSNWLFLATGASGDTCTEGARSVNTGAAGTIG